MTSIRYNITSGALPITVNLKQGVSTIDSNVHTIYETGQFDNQLTGDYTLEMIDANGCVDTREFNQGGCGYGLLYNWWAATDARNIAPAGWHIPTDAEYVILREYLDPLGNHIENIAGTKLKETGLTHWQTGGGTNDVGFNARGSGVRNDQGSCTGLTTGIYLWNSTPYPYNQVDGYLGFIYDGTTWFRIGLTSASKKSGNSIRLIKDNQTDTGTMVGNDGKIYPTVTIGTQVWLAQNLMETRYRDGSLIPEVTDNAEWAALTTGALCAYNNDWNYACLCSAPVEVEFCVEYGCLYNWWAATDARNIAPAGWHVSNESDFDVLVAYLGGLSVAGNKLREIGTIHWQEPNSGATNEVGFNGRGGNYRYDNGSFYTFILKSSGVWWTTTEYDANTAWYYNVYFAHSSVGKFTYTKKYGNSIRIVKDSTTLTHGQTGTYTGNDGKMYRTICIGTQEWVADNLAETKYRNGDLISNHGETYADKYTNEEWAALTTEAMCYYDNDISYAGEVGECPTTTTTTTTTSP